jgi:hypothetical protein
VNTLVLLVDRKSLWSPEAWAEQVGGKRTGVAQIMVEQAAGSWLSIVRDDAVLGDFDAIERSQLAELVADPVAYLVEWRGDSLVELLLYSVMAAIRADGTRAAIDNDHGLVVPVQHVAGEPLESWARASSFAFDKKRAQDSGRPE